MGGVEVDECATKIHQAIRGITKRLTVEINQLNDVAGPAKGEYQSSMPRVALVKSMASTSGVLVHVTDTQTHTEVTLEGTKPSRVVIGHQAPDVSVEERTERSSGRMKLGDQIN